jgi:hypothetical protein
MNYPQIKPTLNLDFSNTKTLDPRINFRRGTPGAYYDGKTYAKAEENLISYSEDFANAYWTSSRAILTGNQDAPDGTSDAFKMQQEGGQTNAGTFRLTSPLALVDHKEYTLSIYAKAGTNRNYLVFFTNLTADRELTFFNLSSGKAVNVNDRHAASVQDVGNDWYRCSITYTPDSAESDYNSAWNVYLTDNDTTRNPVADDSGFIYVWGAQLEQRDSLTAYTPTNGAPVTKYQPQLMFASPDQPRFDHDVLTGESKGLLIEESRTNLIAYSEDFSAWTKTGEIDVDHQGAVGLDNKSFASKITRKKTETTGDQNINITKALGNTNKHSISLRVKPVNDCDLVLNVGSYAARFDFSSLTVIDLKNSGLFDGGQIEHLGNGWYQCSASGTGNSSSVQYQIIPWIGSVGGDWSTDRYHDGDSISGLYIWGAQLEEGSFPTSYIKTSGASVTRSADNASITGENFSSWYRQDEGSLYSEASTSDFRSSYPRFMINDGTASNRFVMSFFGEQGLRVQSNGDDYIDESNAASSDNGNYHKRAIALKKDSFSFYTDGESVLSNSMGEMPMSVNTFAFYNNLAADGADYLSGHIKKLSYYPQRLTNEQLQQLTK